MNKRIKILALPVFVFLAALCFFALSPHADETHKIKFHPLDLMVTIKTKEDKTYRFDVELALRPGEQEKGLMNRASLPETNGMLFVFNNNQRRTFWMKDTLIPLDIIFITEDGRIDHIHSNAQPLDRSFITSGRESWAVLEINGGLADKLGIEEGDIVYHPVFRNLNRLEN